MTPDRMTPDDAALIRYLDGESTADEQRAIDAAAAADPDFAARLDRLRARSERLHALLADADPTVPPALRTFTPGTPQSTADVVPLRPASARPAASVWLRAAMITLLAAAAALMVPPLRAWVVDGLERVGLLSGGEAMPAPVTAPVDTLGISGFEMAAEFTIDVDHAQREGRLTVRIAANAEPQAELHTRGGGESFFVLPDGLRIVNREASTADYMVILPVGARSIRVNVPGVVDSTWTTAVAGEWTVRLRKDDGG